MDICPVGGSSVSGQRLLFCRLLPPTGLEGVSLKLVAKVICVVSETVDSGSLSEHRRPSERTKDDFFTRPCHSGPRCAL
ncbi:unnamed protein product [Protopolystoma xenopodis]|uniref:Uncharacterized protein n=1 Tax=Protopolystoma xenopodis TaxID=117903 RepID=A0A3S5BLS3_9PLAT|nr:unnamed protein product [Protopolystoma xenopodis]